MDSNSQVNVISGSVFDDALTSSSSKYNEGRMPHVGQKVEFSDGRIFRFCSSLETFVAGEMVGIQNAMPVELAGKLTAAAIGATSVIIDLTGVTSGFISSGTVAADKLRDCYLMITDDTGEGYTYRIKSNTATSATVGYSCTLTLYDGLKVAVDTSTDIIISGSPYAHVTEGGTAVKAIGVAVVPTSGGGSTLNYFWVQTKGPATCLAGSGVTAGAPTAAAAGGAVADAAEAGSGAYDQIVGYAIGTTSNGYGPVYLTLE